MEVTMICESIPVRIKNGQQ